jgi:nucleoid-associated protein YgaU
VQRSGEALNKMAFTLFMGKNPQGNIENDLARLKNIANSNTRTIVTGYSSLDGGLWRITSLSVTSILRNVSNIISRATVDIEFTRAVDAIVNVGPVSGGVAKPKTPPTKAKPKPKPVAARYYVMKKGDTLWELAVKYYGSGLKWKILADANKIRNVRTIPIGKKIRIP